jgi:hypothetical protein
MCVLKFISFVTGANWSIIVFMLLLLVRIAGRVPEVNEIKSFIVERPRYVERMKEVA